MPRECEGVLAVWSLDSAMLPQPTYLTLTLRSAPLARVSKGEAENRAFILRDARSALLRMRNCQPHVFASQPVRAKRGPMTGSAKQSRNPSAAARWIASLRSQRRREAITHANPSPSPCEVPERSGGFEGRRPGRSSDNPDLLMQPSSVADAYWQLYQQPKSAWTGEMEIRPFGEKW
jgi:hypothetical protein